MPFLVTVGDTVNCTHQGKASPGAPYPRVKIGGQPIVLLPTPYVVAGCTFPPPPAANGPCVSGSFLTGSTRVLASGTPVLLSTSQSVCAPTGTPLVILVTQTRVQGL